MAEKVGDIINRDCIIVEADSTISKLIGKLRESECKEAVVVKDGRYQGIFDREIFRRSNLDIDHTKIKAATRKNVPKLGEDDSIEEAARKLNTADVHSIPVVDDNEKVLGAVTAGRVIYKLRDRFSDASAEEIGTMGVKALHYNDKISKATELMRENNIDHLPIVDDNDKLTGVVSLYDCVVKGSRAIHGEWTQRERTGKDQQDGFDAGERERVRNVPVSNIMTQIVECCSKQMSGEEIVRQMHENNVSCLVVLENEKPVGIVTIKDFLIWLERYP